MKNLFPSSQHFNFNLIWSTTLIIIISLSSLYPTLSHSKSNHNKKPCSETQAYHYLNIIHNPNGSLTRLNPNPLSPPSPDPSLPIHVLSKDIIINPFKHTWARIFIPHNALHSKKNLPLVLFFHGGGFLFLHASSTIFHTFCFNMAHHLHVIVVSLEYRLAPEHRLPAAYDDAVEALHWIKTSHDPWLRQHSDSSPMFAVEKLTGPNSRGFIQRIKDLLLSMSLMVNLVHNLPSLVWNEWTIWILAYIFPLQHICSFASNLSLLLFRRLSSTSM